MKKSLLAIALATIALSSTAHADYVYKLPLEVAGGGPLPNGTISFGNSGATTPVEPSKPDVEQPVTPVDPFEIEDKRCDPYATTYPENYWGRDLTMASPIIEVDENGQKGKTSYSCKLKNEDPNVLAKYQDVINQTYNDGGVLKSANMCNPLKTNTNAPMTCEMLGSNSYYSYKFTKDSGGNITSLSLNVATLVIPNSSLVSATNQYFIKGVECKNIRPKKNFFGVALNGHYDCDLTTPFSYDEMVGSMGKRFIIEIKKS